ncbi:MAG: alpha-ketoacid dehydrogenase subunit alpha/beta [Salinispira sp.]
MPKNMRIDPKTVRKSGYIRIPNIPVNRYSPDFSSEQKLYGNDRLRKVYYHMIIIREFETAIDMIKKTGSYKGLEYNHRGPAHLSIGQEAAAVGQSLVLDADDFIFGSHRSHGEILAKCLSAADKLDEKKLEKIMKEFLGGDTLAVAEKIAHESVKDLIENFIIYGTYAEIFARNTGFNRGLGGSMHTFFTPLGSMPNNAIVGGSADIAAGSALFKRINRRKGIVIANIGDASMGCGPVWEAIIISSMKQYRQLWNTGGNPPIIFNFFNNFYGMGGQTEGETMPWDMLARVGAGVNEDNLHAERVDGYNPLAVADALTRKRAVLEKGDGPVLMDTITYRISGHSPSDASSYRTKEEIEDWQNADAIESYGRYLREMGGASDGELETLRKRAEEKIMNALTYAVDPELSPYVHTVIIEDVMFSNEKVQAFDERNSEVLIPMDENSRVKHIARKNRYGRNEDGSAMSANKVYAYRDGLFEAMLHRFYEDPSMAAWGEENRDWGGAFAVYRGLTECLPYHRLFNSSISEAAIVGTGVGYALSGGRAVVELMYCDFMGRAGDEIFNQAAKWQAMSAGVLRMPLTVRVSVGNKYGAQHSQDWTSIAAHIPGLKVYYPATPTDAKGMLNLALSGTDPVIFFESQKLYGIGEFFEKSGVPLGYYETPEGEPAIRRTGSDISIVTLGPSLYTAWEVCRTLSGTYQMEAELIDLRFITPLNLDPIIESVKKTGRLLLVTDAVERGSFMHNVAANITQTAFDYLDAPPVIVASRNWITPAAEMEEDYFPQEEWILDSIHEKIRPLPGYHANTVQTTGEIRRQSRRGI